MDPGRHLRTARRGVQQLGGRRKAPGAQFLLVCGLLLLSALAVAALWLWSVHELYLRGPRVTYFLYVAGLIVAALVLRHWPRLAACLLVLALVEGVWGLGSYVLDSGNGRTSLLPPNRREPERFQWHALLQAVPIPSTRLTSAHGLDISHTAQGTRGIDPAPGSLDGRIVVAVYGGSSTYDIALSEGQTWSDRLAEGLGRDRYFVVNNGVPGYTTSEHVLQTAYYQQKFGRPPACAIYYVGWNDLRNAHITGLDPGYADFHLPSQVDSLRLRRIGGSNVTFSPLLTVLGRFFGAEFDMVRYSADPYTMKVGGGVDPRLNEIFERNVRTISAINRARGVRTIWVGQLVNRAALTGDNSYGWLPLVRDRDIWPMIESLRAVLAKVADETGDVSINPDPAPFVPQDFEDNGHFVASGAQRFASALLPAVREACR